MNRSAELNILWLWPDILNLHGDRGNVMALERICGLYGIHTRLTRISRLSENFDPREADIILLGAGELVVMPEIAGALSKCFSGLKEYSESGGVLFCTGTTVSALGVHTLRLDGSRIYGVGLLDVCGRERAAVLGDDIIFRLIENEDAGTGIPVYGIQIQMADLFLGDNQAALGHTTYGYGNNGGGTEGAVSGGFVCTNAHGPVLVKNPWLTLWLIRKAMIRRDPGMAKEMLVFDPSLFGFELASSKAIAAFNEKKEKPK